MSSDNGIYVAQFPKADGSVEFRVAEAAAIDSCDLGFMGDSPERKQMEDAYRVLYFGESKSYQTRDAAVARAVQISDEVEYTEYGICFLKFDRPLADMSGDQAYKFVR